MKHRAEPIPFTMWDITRTIYAELLVGAALFLVVHIL